MNPSVSTSDHDTTATLSPDARAEPVRIGYFNPDAAEVFVAGTFNAWEPRALPMERDATGNWSVTLSLPPGEYHYRLIVDGEWRDHPGAAREILCPFGCGHNAVIVVYPARDCPRFSQPEDPGREIRTTAFAVLRTHIQF